MKREKENESMKIDRERLQLLVYKYAGKCGEAWEAQRAMNAANKEANAVMDEITAYLEEVNTASEKMEGELVRLQKAEAERAESQAAVAVLHTCSECRYLQRGTKDGARQCFCMNIGPEPCVDRNVTDTACAKFSPSLAALWAAAKPGAAFPEEPPHKCGDCVYFVRNGDSTNAGSCAKGVTPVGVYVTACKDFMPQPTAQHTCKECKHFHGWMEDGSPKGFCECKAPFPSSDRNESDSACDEFEKLDRSQA